MVNTICMKLYLLSEYRPILRSERSLLGSHSVRTLLAILFYQQSVDRHKQLVFDDRQQQTISQNYIFDNKSILIVNDKQSRTKE